MFRLKLENRKFYDETSGSYDELYSREQLKKYKLALKYFKPQGRLLNLGCGTGIFEETLDKKMLQDIQVFAIDNSTEMLKKVKLKILKNTFILCADADSLPFRDALFDCCIAFTLLQNMPNPELTLREIARVCKSNASVIVTFLKAYDRAKRFIELLKQSFFHWNLLDDPSLNEYVAIRLSGSEST